jgi:hypothetical protein
MGGGGGLNEPLFPEISGNFVLPTDLEDGFMATEATPPPKKNAAGIVTEGSHQSSVWSCHGSSFCRRPGNIGVFLSFLVASSSKLVAHDKQTKEL